MQLDLDAQPLRFLLDALAYVNVTGSWQPPDATHTNTTHMVLALLSEIGRVETRNLTRRGAARLGLTSTETMRRCPWRLVMGRLLRFNVLRMDASGSVSSACDDAAGRESLVIIASATGDVPTRDTRL